MNDPANDLSSASTDDLILQFAATAKIARTVFSPSGFPSRTPERQRLVDVMHRLGAEICARKPIAEIRKLLEDDDPDVRGWAAPQFLSIDPEWAHASMLGLISKLTTAETLALMHRVRQRPPGSPSIPETSDDALIERFEDAATREYATRFLDVVSEPADMALRNRIVGEITDIMRELKLRGQLGLLIPLLESANVTVRRRSAIACLAVVPDRAVAVLESIAKNGDQLEPIAAKDALDRWRRGVGIIYGVV